MAPTSWTMMYPGTRRHGKSPRAAKAMLTAGFRCAPDTAPMNRMIAITMSPGAVTAAARLIAPSDWAFTTAPPAPTSTRKKVPSSSEKRRRHSCAGLSKSQRPCTMRAPGSSARSARSCASSSVILSGSP